MTAIIPYAQEARRYDALEELGLNPKLANPAKTRMIADSYAKTDRLDATAHALL